MKIEDYEEYIKKAEIKPQWESLIIDDISIFQGKWKTLPKPKSESIDAILKALGYGYIKRIAADNFNSVTEIDMSNSNTDAPTISYRTTFPFGIVKEQTVKFDKLPSEIIDEDTGKWTTYAYAMGGKIYIIRVKVDGILCEVRAVLSKSLDNDDKFTQVFQWTYFNKLSGEVITAERWLKSIT